MVHLKVIKYSPLFSTLMEMVWLKIKSVGIKHQNIWSFPYSYECCLFKNHITNCMYLNAFVSGLVFYVQRLDIYFCSHDIPLFFFFLATLDLSCGMKALVVARRLSCPSACGILVPLPGIEPVSESRFFNYWTTRKIPAILL